VVARSGVFEASELIDRSFDIVLISYLSPFCQGRNFQYDKGAKAVYNRGKQTREKITTAAGLLMRF